MFRLSDHFVFESTLEEIISECQEISGAEDSTVNASVRLAVGAYPNVPYNNTAGNTLCSTDISELCLKADMLSRGKKKRYYDNPFMKFFIFPLLKWFVRANNALPVACSVGATWLLQYQSSIFEETFGLNDNCYYSTQKDILTSAPYFIVFGLQTALVWWLFGWAIGLAYGVLTPILTILYNILKQLISEHNFVTRNMEKWREYLLSHLKVVIDHYHVEK